MFKSALLALPFIGLAVAAPLRAVSAVDADAFADVASEVHHVSGLDTTAHAYTHGAIGVYARDFNLLGDVLNNALGKVDVLTANNPTISGNNVHVLRDLEANSVTHLSVAALLDLCHRGQRHYCDLLGSLYTSAHADSSTSVHTRGLTVNSATDLESYIDLCHSGSRHHCDLVANLFASLRSTTHVSRDLLHLGSSTDAKAKVGTGVGLLGDHRGLLGLGLLADADVKSKTDLHVGDHSHSHPRGVVVGADSKTTLSSFLDLCHRGDRHGCDLVASLFATTDLHIGAHA